MWKEFRTFIARGNVIDLAVGVIIGAAFGTITKSLTDDLIMPLVGALFGGLDFSSYFLRLGPIPEGYAGSLTNYAALKEAGVPLLGFGQFVTVAINFLILAFMIFLLVRFVNRAIQLAEHEQASGEAAPPPEPEEVKLLREIRDALREGPPAA